METEKIGAGPEVIPRGISRAGETGPSTDDVAMDRTMRRIEMQELCDALASLRMDIASVQVAIASADYIAEETQGRLGTLLERLKEAEKEKDR
ncbi:MAG: hypothetical protein KAU99_03245 [Thermoplasmata archaeon]|nr:hypothetical protein [Thermoplasmata archaeon]